MGNDTQGSVLPGEVQAVKQGAGILIGTDGTISVDASSVVGLVKLNSAGAFNGYVWPSVSGTSGQVLTKGTGNALVWANSGVFVSGSAPLNPAIGDLWFDCTVGELLVYEACTTGAPKWTSGAAGLPALPSNTSASPAFASGAGTLLSPYICTASSASVSGTIVVNRVTVTDLAPFQFVNIVDLAGVVNGGRFSFTNNVANASGILVFDILFTDSPISIVGTTYTCQVKIGSGTVYVNAPVTMTDVFVLNSPGSISGSGQIGTPFTYTTGTAAGGSLPIVYTWTWKLFSTNAVLQQNGATYTPLQSQFGDSVYVTLTATDNEGQIVSGSTPDSAPISKPPFPNPTPPTIPTSVGVTSTFIWDGASTTLQSDGCLLFNVNGGTFTDGPTAVTTSQTVSTKWADSAPGVCGEANTGTFIEGCLFDASFSACGSLTIDRTPNNFSFDPATTTPSGVATSTAITITGNNAPGFITVGSGSDGLAGSYQASIGGGSFQTVPPAGTYSLPILSGQTLAVRFTAGASALTTYNFNVQIGDSTGSTNATFAVTTTNSNFPTTSITFPTTTSGTGSVGTSVAWGNGTTNITGTGCIEFSVDGGSSYTQTSTSITNGVVLKTRYKAGATCADNTNGQTIVGGITNTTSTESTSLQIGRVPAAVTIATVSGATTSTQYTTSILPTTGFNSTGYVTLGGGTTLTSVQASIGGGAFTAIPSSGTTLPIEPGQSIQIRGTTGGTFSTDYIAQVNMGVSGTTTTSTWTVQVGAAVPAVATPNISTPGNGDINVGTSSGLTITSSAYSASGGAGGHASSTWQVYAAEGVVPVTSPIQSVSSTPTFTYTFDRSVRFDPVNSSSFKRTYSVPGNRRIFSWSAWVKRGVINTAQGLFVWGNASQDQFNFGFDSSNRLVVTDIISNVTTANLITTPTYTNTSEWIHVLLTVNTTTSVSTNRIRLFVNGEQVTSFSTAIYYPQNAETSANSATFCNIGGSGVPFSANLNLYATGIIFADGTAYLPDEFGVLSGTSWIPVDFTGSFGTTGYELLFNTNPTQIPNSGSLGKDTSGNSNDFVPAGFYLGNADDLKFGWNQSPAPTTVSYLGVGAGGLGGTRQGGGDGIAGGGGGGVIEGTLSTPVGTYFPFSIAQQPTGPTGNSVVFQTLTAGCGVPGAPTFFSGNPGGPSGLPQSNPGGAGQPGGGGGGGAGGPGSPQNANAGGPGGPGLIRSIRGSSESYGEGGPGTPLGASGAPSGAGGPWGGAGLVVAYNDTLGLASVGAGVTSTIITAGGQRSYTFTSTYAGSLPFQTGILIDSPTPGGQTDTGAGGVVVGNYPILDSSKNGGATLSRTGLSYVSSSPVTVMASLPVLSGKYYWEVQCETASTIGGFIGLAKSTSSLSSNPGFTSNSYAYNLSSGQIATNSTSSNYGNAIGAGQVFGVAFDADNGKLYFAINNVWQNSANPVTSVNPAFSDLLTGPYFAAFGGAAASTVTVNFGARPYVYNAPVGYKSLTSDPVFTTLTFDDDTFLSSFQIGNAVSEVSGDASGSVAGVNIGTNQMTVAYTVGTWTVGSTVENDSRTVPAPAPTTEPPNPLLYTLIASATNSTVDLTSFPVSVPPLDPLVTYYTRVKYKSTATVTESSYSAWSQFTTGNLT
jgi:hypothetical protein